MGQLTTSWNEHVHIGTDREVERENIPSWKTQYENVARGFVKHPRQSNPGGQEKGK